MVSLMTLWHGYVKPSNSNDFSNLVMVSYSCMTMPGTILLIKLKNYCKCSIGKSGASPIQSRFGIPWLFPFPAETEVTLIYNKVLFGQWCENGCPGLAQWAEMWFLSTRNKHLDKCLNRFNDYVKMWSRSMPLNSLLLYL